MAMDKPRCGQHTIDEGGRRRNASNVKHAPLPCLVTRMAILGWDVHDHFTSQARDPCEKSVPPIEPRPMHLKREKKIKDPLHCIVLLARPQSGHILHEGASP